MKGFIFAAGFGRRLSPLTDSIPKSLIPVLNIESICYALMLLKESGIKDIICNLHYKSENIINFFKSNKYFDLNLTFSIEEEILGTGGGLKKCERYLHNQDFVIINSDVIMDIDLSKLIKYHANSPTEATIVLHKTEQAKRIGQIGIEQDKVVDFKNYLKTGNLSNFIYTGVACLSPKIFAFLTREFSSIVYTGYIDIIKHSILRYYEHTGIWEDIGAFNSYLQANMNLLSNKESLGKRFLKTIGKKIEPVSPDAIIHSSAVIKNSIIGKGSVISRDAMIKNSVIFPGSTISEGQKIINSTYFKDRIIS